MTLKYSNLGLRYDLEVVQGSTLAPIRHTLRHASSNTLVDLTGCTIDGEVRHDARSEAFATFTIVLASDRSLGYYDFSLAAADTAAIPAGDSLISKSSAHEYSIRMRDAQGSVIPLLWGTFAVQADRHG